MEIRKLNTIRGLAAIIVLITHFSDVTGWLDGSLGGRAGQYGVMLFFLLSGFLMAYLYIDKAFNKEHVVKYVLARIGRVAPLYLILVLLSYLLCYYGIEVLYKVPDIQTLMAHLIFIYGDSVLWTVAVEVQFYAVFVALWCIYARKPGYLYVIIVSVLMALFFTDFVRFGGDILGMPYNTRVFKSLPYFFIGVIFGMHYQSIRIPGYLKKHWFIAALLLIPLMYPEFSPVNSDAKMRMWLSYEVLLVMSAVFFSVVFLVPDNNILLSNKIGDYLGKISYSLYLLHLPIIVQVNKLDLAVEIKLTLVLAICIALATLSFLLIEKPLKKIVKNSVSDKFSPQSAASRVAA